MPNLTCDDTAFSESEVILAGFITPIVCFFGLFSNLINIGAFLHKTQRSLALNWYLLCLSMSDVVALSSSIAMIAMPVISELTQNVTFETLVNYGIRNAYPIGMIAQTASVYFTVSASAHRFFGVVYPYSTDRYCNERIVRITISSLVLMAVCYNFSRFFELTVGDCISLDNITKTLILPTDLRVNDSYKTMYILWSYTFTMLVFPFAVLICMNIRVICEIHKTRKRHFRLLRSVSCNIEDSHNKLEATKERSTTIMLIGVSLSFLACNLMALVCNLLEILNQKFAYSEAVSISNLLVVVNMSINTLIYWIFSNKFRIAVRAVFLRQSNNNYCEFDGNSKKDISMLTMQTRA